MPQGQPKEGQGSLLHYKSFVGLKALPRPPPSAGNDIAKQDCAGLSSTTNDVEETMDEITRLASDLRKFGLAYDDEQRWLTAPDDACDDGDEVHDALYVAGNGETPEWDAVRLGDKWTSLGDDAEAGAGDFYDSDNSDEGSGDK
eukprot:85622-Prymnesium_polylepis.1